MLPQDNAYSILSDNAFFIWKQAYKDVTISLFLNFNQRALRDNEPSKKYIDLKETYPFFAFLVTVYYLCLESCHFLQIDICSLTSELDYFLGVCANQRPRKIFDLLASRACRTAIMIGDSLTQKQMEHVVLNLAGLESPWNCPHGRPTMRHLGEIHDLVERADRTREDLLSFYKEKLSELETNVEISQT